MMMSELVNFALRKSSGASQLVADNCNAFLQVSSIPIKETRIHFAQSVPFTFLTSTPSANLEACSFFKTLVDQEVVVELKNDISIRGTLKSVDQYLNIKLDDIGVLEEVRYPHMVSRGFVRGLMGRSI